MRLLNDNELYDLLPGESGMRAILWDDRRVWYAVRTMAVFCFPPTLFGQATHRSLSATTLLAPASTSAQSIFELCSSVLTVTAAIFVVFGLLAYSVVKLRRKRQGDGPEPRQVYGSNQAGFAWTVIPLLIIVALFWQQRE